MKSIRCFIPYVLDTFSANISSNFLRNKKTELFYLKDAIKLICISSNASLSFFFEWLWPEFLELLDQISPFVGYEKRFVCFSIETAHDGTAYGFHVPSL